MPNFPKNPDNLTLYHAEKARDAAWKAFKEYEDKVDLEKPQESDHLYAAYRLALDEARSIITHVGVESMLAELPDA